MVVPMTPAQGSPSFLVNEVTTVLDDIPAPSQPITNATLEFGLTGEPSTVKYHAAHYFFAAP
jgi:hypothetical protein